MSATLSYLSTASLAGSFQNGSVIMEPRVPGYPMMHFA